MERNSRKTSERNVLFTIVLNLIITITEIIGGVFSHSLSLISDSMHNLSDTLAGALTLWTMNLSKKESNNKFTFGYKRAEIISAFINSSILAGLALILIKEAITKFANPIEIKTVTMFIVALIGLISNIVGALLLHKHSRENINIRSAYLHLFSDAISSVGVVTASILMHFWHLNWLDPLITILIAGYMLLESAKIIKESISILMECSPELIDIDSLKEDLEKVKNVQNIHHVHIWRLTDKDTLFEAHVNVDNVRISDTKAIKKEIEKILNSKYNITHITIQFENKEHVNESLIHH